ncbi:hypothetical protein [Micromonospora yangpuensis]|uniref:Uncharacterized protein n=1 Tax=Micromonospora yangpuensis TaxID=683228 RepID=A0A1C6VG34_9ACTN|nr:hypothetical protein [Micromonospora yangpuensis]GGM31395.1 hypothetical protein GCM10012279_57850 [Micromonospora yangpuensis]SCL65255.1 hypothetical protein GA0070617_5709 [Micromonospora yangpuensis]
MSYQLSAVVADVELLREQTVGLDHAVLAALRQDFALLPVTSQLVEELTGTPSDFATGEPGPQQPFGLVLSAAFTATLEGWSRLGPVAYLEAEFAGGLGRQASVVWLGGAVSFGPAYDDRLDGPRPEWPVNAALARLGVEPGRWIDLFAEVGLHLERHTEGWLAHGRRGLSADYWDELAEEWEEQSGGDQQPQRSRHVGDWGIP